MSPPPPPAPTAPPSPARRRARRGLLLAGAAGLALGACQPEAEHAAGGAGVPTVTGTLVLVDDGAADPAFSAFRESLRDVVARRDTAALLAVVAPGARLSYGDEPGGPEGLRRMWLDGGPPAGEAVWAVLERILNGGSVAEDGAVTVPSVAALWPEALDPFGHVAVPSQDVDALDAPGGRLVARLTETVLPVRSPAADGWQPVWLPDGREAVVAAGETLSPVGYRATFWDDGDGWRLRSFLSGD